MPSLFWEDPARPYKRACYQALARSRFGPCYSFDGLPQAEEVQSPGVYALSTSRPPKHAHLVRRAVRSGPVTICRNLCGSTLVNPVLAFRWYRRWPGLCPWCETADRVRAA